MTQRVLLTIEYDGRPYCGWQKQNDRPSVQQTIEEALANFDEGTRNLQCAGRTDAGVHAYAMRAHVDITRNLDANRIKEALNYFLKNKAIVILDVTFVAPDFNARFHCLGRSYLYYITNRRAPLTFGRGLSWHVPVMLNIEAMQKSTQYLLGQHDFSAFRAKDCQAKSPIKTLDYLDVTLTQEGCLVRTHARSYLYNQIRNIVGTLGDVGRGRFSPQDVKTILKSKNRNKAGVCAPAEGLYFWKAWYDESEGPEVLKETFFTLPAVAAFPHKKY